MKNLNCGREKTFDASEAEAGCSADAGKRGEVLLEALRIINGERQDQYGNPEDCFGRIAMLWTDYLGTEISPHDVAMLMALLKIARIQAGSGKKDSYTDAAGYIGLAADMADDKGSR